MPNHTPKLRFADAELLYDQKETDDENSAEDTADAVNGTAERTLYSAESAYRSRKSHQDNGEETSSSKAKTQQKKGIKKEYAASKAEGAYKASEGASKAAKKSEEAGKKVTQFVAEHKKTFLIIGILALLLLLILSAASSCSLMFEGLSSTIVSSTYPSRDEDMLAAEQAYSRMEEELREYLNHYEESHGYDECRFDLDEIGHDPYVLISAVTALEGGAWTVNEAEDSLRLLFEKQYILTETVHTETCYVTETDPESGEVRQTPYAYTIAEVKLDNFDLSHVPVYVMTEDQLEVYAMYMATLGNRPDLFPDSAYVGMYITSSYEKYMIPPEALEDERFARLIAEAEKYLGYPYVWGGSSPSTSFDCSGYVSWVLNHCGVGWNFGRLGAKALSEVCTHIPPSSAAPGDLIFFKNTYDTGNDYASHVGIYVGNGMMLHCGDPIQYTSIETSYWQLHFLTFGRLPEP